MGLPGLLFNVNRLRHQLLVKTVVEKNKKSQCSCNLKEIICSYRLWPPDHECVDGLLFSSFLPSKNHVENNGHNKMTECVLVYNCYQ